MCPYLQLHVSFSCNLVPVSPPTCPRLCPHLAPRTYPKDYKPADEGPNEYQTIPLDKIEDFGVHAKSYYQLDVTFFKSSTDRWACVLARCGFVYERVGAGLCARQEVLPAGHDFKEQCGHIRAWVCNNTCTSCLTDRSCGLRIAPCRRTEKWSLALRSPPRQRPLQPPAGPAVEQILGAQAPG